VSWRTLADGALAQLCGGGQHPVGEVLHDPHLVINTRFPRISW